MNTSTALRARMHIRISRHYKSRLTYPLTYRPIVVTGNKSSSSIALASFPSLLPSSSPLCVEPPHHATSCALSSLFSRLTSYAVSVRLFDSRTSASSSPQVFPVRHRPLFVSRPILHRFFLS
jgi:hypothetical protein